MTLITATFWKEQARKIQETFELKDNGEIDANIKIHVKFRSIEGRPKIIMSMEI